MSVAVKLAAFVAVLVLCFGAAYAVGAAVGPIGDGGDADHPDHVAPTTTAPAGHGAEHGS